RYRGATPKVEGTEGRKIMRRRTIVVLSVIACLAIAAGGLYATAAGDPSTSRSSFAQRLLNSPGSRFMTSPARTALQLFATGESNLGSPSPLQGSIEAEPTAPVKAVATVHTEAGLAPPNNVRVNDPWARPF